MQQENWKGTDLVRSALFSMAFCCVAGLILIGAVAWKTIAYQSDNFPLFQAVGTVIMGCVSIGVGILFFFLSRQEKINQKIVEKDVKLYREQQLKDMGLYQEDKSASSGSGS